MIERIQQSRLGRIPGRLYKWLQHEMAPALLRRRIIGAALIAWLLAAVYWLLIASDRYVSEARVIVQRADLAGVQGADLSGLLNGLAGGGASRADMLLLRDHLRSVDMLKKLDAALNLRAHYSDASRDLLSRMWFADAPMEWFHRHYLSRVSIELDDYAGVLTIRT
ncbi:MAG: chain-length determining protein, partial [Azospira oryzae]